MIYGLLGELEISGDGLLLELPAGPAQLVLAALLVNVNRRMSKSTLIRVAWGGELVGEAQLPKRIGQIRDLLEQIGRRGDLKTHSGFGYEMRVDDEDIDTLLFGRFVRQAEEAGRQRDPETEIRLLREALRLWRGSPPLSNLPGDAFRREVQALEQRHRRAAVRLFELETARGNHQEILDELISVTSYYAADRRLSEQLMIVQYRCGHPTDVMRVYERYRAALEEETGGKPDPLLRSLHFAIARGDEQAAQAAQDVLAKRSGTVPSVVQVTAPSQVPRSVKLVGRDNLLAEVTWLLSREPVPEIPVIVISGSGGVGKTALALRAAHDTSDRFSDGQLYFELRGTTEGAIDTSEVAAQFLRALGVPRIPETKAERLAAYRTALAGRRILIVLDDAVDGSQVSELAPASPGCAVLVTARQRLPDVSGAHHVSSLEPLGRADATELFLLVVSEAGIKIEDDQAAIDRVVELCGGLPLALRLAGALRVHDHPRPTAELADWLEARGPDALEYGKLSVAKTLGAGFDRLDEAGRRLFLGFGLLPLGRFGLWTACAVLDSTDAASAAALSQLAHSFMLEPIEPDLRYRFHDLTREYARRLALAEYPGDHTSLPAAVYNALLTLARRAHRRLYGGDFEVAHSAVADWDAPASVTAEVDRAPIDWFEKERLNIRAAVEHCAALGLIGLCWDLAVSSHEFYAICGYFDDWYATHTVALEACRRSGNQRGEGILLACLNQPTLVASRRIDSATSLAEAERSVGLLAAGGDRVGQAIAVRTLAHALRRQGHLSKPLSLFLEALGHYRASGDKVGAWQALRFIGQIFFDQGDHENAREALEQAAAISAELESVRLTAQTQYWLGQACLALGDIDTASTSFGMVLEAFDYGSGVGHAYALHGQGDLARRTGAYDLARQHYITAAELARECGDSALESRVWRSLAELRRAQGHLAEQVGALRQAADVAAENGAARLEIQALAALARVMAELGETGAADEAWSRVEELYLAADLPTEDRLYLRPESSGAGG